MEWGQECSVICSLMFATKHENGARGWYRSSLFHKKTSILLSSESSNTLSTCCCLSIEAKSKPTLSDTNLKLSFGCFLISIWKNGFIELTVTVEVLGSLDYSASLKKVSPFLNPIHARFWSCNALRMSKISEPMFFLLLSICKSFQQTCKRFKGSSVVFVSD